MSDIFLLVAHGAPAIVAGLAVRASRQLVAVAAAAAAVGGARDVAVARGEHLVVRLGLREAAEEPVLQEAQMDEA